MILNHHWIVKICHGELLLCGSVSEAPETVSLVEVLEMAHQVRKRCDDGNG
jgi:uncharacterized protein YegJ (DUF2314 family)